MNNQKKWNWQQKDWPNFTFSGDLITWVENQFLHSSGILLGAYKHITENEKINLTTEIMSDEALKTSEIEGEILNRSSILSSIQRNFGLNINDNKSLPAEKGIAEMMVDLYKNFKKPLTHQSLFNWHKMLMSGKKNIKDIGKYRSGTEPMQVVSGSIDNLKIHFKAPDSKNVKYEMAKFIEWFNNSSPTGTTPLSILARSSIAHLYFVSIHPFEDGNGRIARALSIKAISQSLNNPVLLTLSQLIQSKKNEYYLALEKSNKNNQVDEWIKYFSSVIIKSQEHSLKLIEFLIKKAKFFELYKSNLNERQEKVILRIFKEGIDGFKGGLSTKNYISITKTSRATATRDLIDLVSKNILTQTGVLKSTRYFLKLE